jgi:hypothetical protein
LLRRLEAANHRNRELTDENQWLRRQLARALGDQRTELHDEWQAFDRRYLSEASMAELFTDKPNEPARQIAPPPAAAPATITGSSATTSACGTSST